MDCMWESFIFNAVSEAGEMRCDLHSNGVGDQVDQWESEAVMESRLMAQPQDGEASECVHCAGAWWPLSECNDQTETRWVMCIIVSVWDAFAAKPDW